jgi:hypothetical protein
LSTNARYHSAVVEKKEPSQNPEIKPVMDGIQLILGEMRDLRTEMAEDRRRADEERRRADERFQKFVEDSEARFLFYVKRSEAREKGLHEAMQEIGRVGREIVVTQKHHTVLLTKILKTLQGGLNGRHGNGHGRGR